MAIINHKELGQESSKFLKRLEQWLSDSVNYIFIGTVVWIGLMVTMICILPAADYGINAWWVTYSADNPGVVIESTALYWFYVIATFILKATVFLQTMYMFMVWAVYLVRPVNRRISARTPVKSAVDDGYLEYAPPEDDDDDELEPLVTTKHIDGKNQPICPKCKQSDQVIKKGTRQCYQRYLCKRDMIYFKELID